MTIRELIDQLSELPAELPVYVAGTLGDDQCELELVLPHLGREDDDYVLLCADHEEE